MIIMTSFKRSTAFIEHYDRTEPKKLYVWNAAVYQPKGFSLPKVTFADIRDASGQWTRPREFARTANPLEMYKHALFKLYVSRMVDIMTWFNKYGMHDHLFCCWCPYERAAQRQLKQWGTYVCHLGVLGAFLKQRPGAEVRYDKDRGRMVKFA